MRAQRARLNANRSDGHKCRWRNHGNGLSICAICRKTSMAKTNINVGSLVETKGSVIEIISTLPGKWNSRISSGTEKPTEDSCPMRACDVPSQRRPDAL